jgi:hypothetical protein
VDSRNFTYTLEHCRTALNNYEGPTKKDAAGPRREQHSLATVGAMTSFQVNWGRVDMSTQRQDDLEAVLRTLKLAQAQLRSLKGEYLSEPLKENDIEDTMVAIDLLVKKLVGLIVADP